MNRKIIAQLPAMICPAFSRDFFVATSRPALRRACMLFAIVSITFAGTGQATIIEFDQIRDSSGNVVPTVSGNGPEADYGDRVNAAVMAVPGGEFTYGNDGEGLTPNVALDFFAGNATSTDPRVSLWGSQYGDLNNVLIGNNNSISLNVLLSADTGFDVQLYNFDLAGWPSSDYTINAVRVLDGSNTLFSQNDVLVEGDASGPGHTMFDFATPLTGSALQIQIDYSNLAGSQQDNIGIDNIRFGQNPPAVVPVPAAWLLFLSGLLPAGLYRRGKKCN